MTSSWLSLIAATAQPPASLVPATPSAAPDYYCTWNLQGYVCSYGAGAGSNDLRLEINEDNLFGSQLGYKVWGREQAKTTQTSGQPPREVSWIVPARYQGWLSHYPMLHADLTFVMDDSWDIPRGPGADGASKRPHGRNYDNEYLATMSIAPDRFPSFRGDDQQRMTLLVKAVKELGNINGRYLQQRVDVSAQPLRWDRKVGVFGHCRSLTLRYQGGLPAGTFTVYAQDLATDDAPAAIPYVLTPDGRGIILQGADLETLCQGHDYPYTEVEREAGKDYSDQSDPAVVLLVVEK